MVPIVHQSVQRTPHPNIDTLQHARMTSAAACCLVRAGYHTPQHTLSLQQPQQQQQEEEDRGGSDVVKQQQGTVLVSVLVDVLRVEPTAAYRVFVARALARVLVDCHADHDMIKYVCDGGGVCVFGGVCVLGGVYICVG